MSVIDRSDKGKTAVCPKPGRCQKEPKDVPKKKRLIELSVRRHQTLPFALQQHAFVAKVRRGPEARGVIRAQQNEGNDGTDG